MPPCGTCGPLSPPGIHYALPTVPGSESLPLEMKLAHDAGRVTGVVRVAHLVVTTVKIPLPGLLLTLSRGWVGFNDLHRGLVR